MNPPAAWLHTKSKGYSRSCANLRRDGYAVVFITHKLKEVLACADRITVMRRGKVAGTLPAREPRRISLSRSCLAKKSARLPGAETRLFRACSSSPGTERGPYPGRRRNRRASRHSFNHPARRDRGSGRGVGNGQRELGDVILGLEKIEKGPRIFWARDATQWSVAQIRAMGVAFIPETRWAWRPFPGSPCRRIWAMADTRRYSRQGGFSMDWAAVCSDLDQSLSASVLPFLLLCSLGHSLRGNVQRMILARRWPTTPN